LKIRGAVRGLRTDSWLIVRYKSKTKIFYVHLFEFGIKTTWWKAEEVLVAFLLTNEFSVYALKT